MRINARSRRDLVSAEVHNSEAMSSTVVDVRVLAFRCLSRTAVAGRIQFDSRHESVAATLQPSAWGIVQLRLWRPGRSSLLVVAFGLTRASRTCGSAFVIGRLPGESETGRRNQPLPPATTIVRLALFDRVA